MTAHADMLAAALRAASAALAELDPMGERHDAALLDDALASHGERTFAQDCHGLADRAHVVLNSNPGLRPYERNSLRALRSYGHVVGDDADCAPDLYTEPRA